MAILDQIGLEKRRISQRLALLDTERTKLGSQLEELEIAERALRRFGGKAVANGKPATKRNAKAASRAGEKRRAANGQRAARMPLGDAALQAVRAHAKGASASDLITHLSREFGLTVRPNHLGMALQRHRRAGRLEHRDQRWYLSRLT
ncbi:MAG: hypothetical protein JO096_03320 [Alphaproteobacteria bacterium]|nr:hypothetical protein [Alphaproteobacteria bacterium]